MDLGVTFFLVAESMARLNDGEYCRARKIALRAGTRFRFLLAEINVTSLN